MIDVTRALKAAATTGDVRFGLEQAKKSLKKGEAKMVVIAKNCPDKDIIPSGSQAKVLMFEGTNAELGNACGKPFAISVLTVINPGESNILSA